MLKILSIIPARGGSKRLPGKNIKQLAGKPLIVYTIESSLNCKFINRTVVSTDCEEIEKISIKANAKVIKRPNYLARDDSKTIDVIKHTLAVLEKEENYSPDVIVMLQPTSPLRNLEDIKNAIELFYKESCASVISVTEKNPYWNFKIENDYLNPLFGWVYLIDKRKQDMPKTYAVNGAIYITTKKNLYKNNSFFNERITPYIMPQERSIDIDEKIDFEFVEFLMKKNSELKKLTKIEDKKIGNNQPCFIIAEAGVNHNGNIASAKKLIDAAKEADVDAVKFQTFKAELIVTESADQAEYQKETAKDDSQFAMLKKLELKEEHFKELKEYCDDKGIIFLSTSHSDNWSVDILDDLVAAYKTGSGDINNLPILKYMAKKGKPLIVATGTANLEEVKEAKEAIESEGNKDIILLHCTTMYPSPENKVNLRAMETMRKELGGLIGYSDHTTGLETPIIAACMNPVLYEKHFTLDKNMEGPDHKASLNPEELKAMVEAIRYVEENKITDPYVAFKRLNEEKGYSLNVALIETILGKAEKVPEPEELEIAKVARKSIVAIKDIKESEELTEENVGIRRPGEGLAPKYYDELIGKRAKKNINKDTYVKLEDIE